MKKMYFLFLILSTSFLFCSFSPKEFFSPTSCVGQLPIVNQTTVDITNETTTGATSLNGDPLDPFNSVRIPAGSTSQTILYQSGVEVMGYKIGKVLFNTSSAVRATVNMYDIATGNFIGTHSETSPLTGHYVGTSNSVFHCAGVNVVIEVI